MAMIINSSTGNGHGRFPELSNATFKLKLQVTHPTHFYFYFLSDVAPCNFLYNIIMKVVFKKKYGELGRSVLPSHMITTE